jgi:hypothetical protein
MNDDHPPAAGHRDTHHLSRRQLMGTVGLASASALVAPALTVAATPEASPATQVIDANRVLALSDRLTGGATLAQSAAGDLVALLEAEPDIAASLAELEGVTEFTPDSLAATSPAAQMVATNILQFWFLGRYANEPVANRASMYFGFASWPTLPYATQQSLCKSYGYWAQEIELPG